MIQGNHSKRAMTREPFLLSIKFSMFTNFLKDARNDRFEVLLEKFNAAHHASYHVHSTARA